MHTAIGQAVNYLVGLDENREHVRDTYGVDARRASATVLIGHPACITQQVEVTTYKELVAARSGR